MPKYCAALLITILVCLPFSAQGQSNNGNATLTEADRLAMLYNWPRAIPLYVKAENEFQAVSDKVGELEARLGWIQTQALPGAIRGFGR
jgi:hypothetical protein